MLVAIITVVITLLLVIMPVRIAARYVGAQRTSLFMCLAAIVISYGMDAGAYAYIGQPRGWEIAFYLLASLLMTVITYMLVLGTTFLGGILISVIQIILTVVIIFIIALLGIGLNMAL